MRTQSATPSRKPAGAEEIRLWLRPGQRGELEALSVDMQLEPWQILNMALQNGCLRYGAVPRASEAELAATLDDNRRPENSEPVVVWMSPGRMREVAAVAASMKMGFSTAVGILLPLYYQDLGPERQTVLLRGRERATSHSPLDQNVVSLDVRQQTLVAALDAIAEIAAGYPPEGFPVDARLATRLDANCDAVCGWLQGLNRARAAQVGQLL